MGAELEVVVPPGAERPSYRPRRWLGPWPLAVPTRASPQCLTRSHAPQSGCMAVLGYRCTAFKKHVAKSFRGSVVGAKGKEGGPGPPIRIRAEPILV